MVHKALNEGSAGEALQRCGRRGTSGMPILPSMKAAPGRRCNGRRRRLHLRRSPTLNEGSAGEALQRVGWSPDHHAFSRPQ